MSLMRLGSGLAGGGLWRYTSGLFGVQDPTLSINGYDIENWSPNHALLDISKQMSNWDSSGGNLDWMIAQGYVDANEGWITATTLPSNFYKTLVIGGNGYLNNRQYRLRWTGAGTLTAPAGATIDSSSANEIVFTLPDYDTNITNYVQINATSGPILSMEMVDTQFTARYDAGERLNPDYLEIIKDVREFRFMVWQHTNGSTQDEWNTRPVLTQNSYSTEGSTQRHKKGVPIEIEVELCNKIKADMWFPFPAGATDDYITQAVTYINANLHPDLICTFEMSNEVWNFIENRSVFEAQGNLLWPDAVGVEGEFGIGMSAYIYRTWEIQPLVNAIMPASRTRFVLNASGDWQLTPQVWIDYAGNPSSTSAPYESPWNRIGHWAITGYFGLGLFSDSARATAIESAYPATSDSVIDGYLRTPGTDTASIGTLQGVTDAWTGVNSYCITNGIKMVQYEGGPHSIYNNMAQVRVDAMGQWLQSSLGAAFATDLMDVWATMSEAEGPMSQFQDIGPWSGFGTWTLAETLLDTPQGYHAQLLTESASRGNWWGDTTDHRHAAI